MWPDAIAIFTDEELHQLGKKCPDIGGFYERIAQIDTISEFEVLLISAQRRFFGDGAVNCPRQAQDFHAQCLAEILRTMMRTRIDRHVSRGALQEQTRGAGFFLYDFGHGARIIG